MLRNKRYYVLWPFVHRSKESVLERLKMRLRHINVKYNIDMSLNNLIDNILLIARNSNIGESEHLSRHQIELWIKGYRAFLIKQQLDKDGEIDDAFISTIEPIHLDAVETSPGKITYVGDKELPTLIGSHKRSGVIAVRDMYGNPIQIGSATKAKFQKYRKATCGDYIAWIKDNRVHVEGDSNQIEYVSVDVVAEDPTATDCYNPDEDYPMPGAMIPTLTQLIMDRELRFMLPQPSDVVNNTEDNTQNIYKKQ